MSLKAILQEHRSVTGAMGAGTSDNDSLVMELRQHKRGQLTVVGLLAFLVVLSTCLGIWFCIQGIDTGDFRLPSLVSTGLAVAILLECFRRACREWVRTDVALRLLDGLPSNQRALVLDRLVGAV